MHKEFELVYTSLMLKIDLRHACTKINITSLLSHKHNRASLIDRSLSDISINTIMLLTLGQKKHMSEVLNHPRSITDIITEFTSN